MKKSILALVLVCFLLAAGGCAKNSPEETKGSDASEGTKVIVSDAEDFTIEEIHVVSREQGSGTRSAFVELTGIEEKDDAGNKTDHTSEEATIVNKTDVMLTTVAGDETAIGYVSLGSLSSDVKAISVDSVAPSAETIKSEEYSIARPFYIATKGESEGVTADFIEFILSEKGQEIVSNGYISVGVSDENYATKEPEGKIVVAGSSSVTPIMEKLAEAYKTVNSNAEIEIQMSDSSAGANAAMEGTCDIGMISRNLKDSEAEKLKGTVIAMDGIAVIVNPKNSIDSLTKDQIKQIFTGEVMNWDF